MGVSSRTDALLYLTLRRDGGHPSLIAREVGYTQRGIDHALAAMTLSGWVVRTEGLREVVYMISDPVRETLFSSLGRRPEWLTWTPFFRALEVIWQTLDNPSLAKMPVGGQSAELQGAMLKAVFSRNPGGFSGYFTEIKSRAGEAYIDSLAEAWDTLFAFLSD
jgi:hypothetical protein